MADVNGATRLVDQHQSLRNRRRPQQGARKGPEPQQIPQILSIPLFEKVELYQALTATVQQNEDFSLRNQLKLFDL